MLDRVKNISIYQPTQPGLVFPGIPEFDNFEDHRLHLKQRLVALEARPDLPASFEPEALAAEQAALAQQEAFLANIFDSQSSAFYTSGHMLDDGMIDPRDSRKTLGFLLETVWETRHRKVRPNSFGIARM